MLEFKTSLTSIHKLRYRFPSDFVLRKYLKIERCNQADNNTYSSIEPSSKLKIYMLELMSVTTNNFFHVHISFY